MPKTKIRHRDGMEGFTECGKSLDRPGLLAQPSDGSGDPVTCKACIRILTDRCYKCNKLVTTYRDFYHDRRSSEQTTWLALHCPECKGRLRFGNRVGERAITRKRREQLASSLAARKQKSVETRLEWKREWDAERSELEESGVLHDGCAICGQPLPDNRIMERGWNKSLPEQYRRGSPQNWHDSRFDFLRWRYCPEHFDLGVELENTLTVAFRSQAAAILEQVSGRVSGTT